MIDCYLQVVQVSFLHDVKIFDFFLGQLGDIDLVELFR